MATTHELKTIPPFFEDVRLGRKTFEFRKNDRNFRVGDSLELREYLPASKAYSGRQIKCKIVYILSDFEGIKDGYAILGIADVEESLPF